MPRIQTKCFGRVEYAREAVFDFFQGIPGFEDETEFLFLEQPSTHPLLFMQSIAHSQVCFILLPILSADPHYKLRLTEDDLAALHLPPGRQPQIGTEVLCAALVCAAGDERPQPTLNLLAPILVNLKERIGIQAIQTQSGYSHRHPLMSSGPHMEMALCS
jgi:flagellar assembly factor FliW